MKSHDYKPICLVHLDRQYAIRRGLVTAAKQAPKGALQITGLPVPGAPGYRPGPVLAWAARRIAEAQPGGAVIVWQDDKHEYAHVYSRPARMEA